MSGHTLVLQAVIAASIEETGILSLGKMGILGAVLGREKEYTGKMIVDTLLQASLIHHGAHTLGTDDLDVVLMPCLQLF